VVVSIYLARRQRWIHVEVIDTFIGPATGSVVSDTIILPTGVCLFGDVDTNGSGCESGNGKEEKEQGFF
jgi:hypothetical protein